MRSTRGTLLVAAGVALAATSLVSFVIGRGTTRQVGAAWLALAALLTLGLFVYTGAFAAENRSPTTHQRYDWIGLPTAVTLFRGTIIAWVGGLVAFVVLGESSSLWAWFAAIGYGIAAALDSVDGALARRTNRVTVLGSRLDMTVDALGLIVAPLAGVALGQLPWWYLSVGVARYVFVAGLWWRHRVGKPTFELPPRESRRVLAGLQMAFVPVALAPGIADEWIPSVAALAAGGLLLGFARDWLYVSGRLGEPARQSTPTPAEE
ncbi:CDP-alcohol phosphatidyltransferase family protein [Haloferax sp. DFSO60]|uniref:CDP-alcohol phosphatidyltransferase family protein n=1 Tax=Haloferax sp. DFSO60 TaxID=3388652 RepID=UPI00397BD77C